MHLFLCNSHVISDVSKYCRLDVVTACPDSIASGQQFRTFLLAFLDVPQYFVHHFSVNLQDKQLVY